MGRYERELKRILEKLGYTVIRSAGSMGEGDLVVLEDVEDPKSYVIEAKSVKDSTFYTSNTKKDKEQYKEMKQKQKNKNKIAYLYAVRYKGLNSLRGKDEIDKWRVFNPTNFKIMNISDGFKLDYVFDDIN